MSNNSKQEFNKRFYVWCKSELTQEFNNDFYYTKRVKNKFNYRFFKTLQTFSDSERELILNCKIKCGAFGSEYILTEQEEKYLEDVRKKDSMEAYKDIEYFHTLYKKFNIKEVKKTMIDTFNTNVCSKLPSMKLTFKSNTFLTYEIKINSWLIYTRISLNKGSYDFSHTIRTDNWSTVLKTVSFPIWVGFHDGWCFFDKDDINEAAHDIAYHSLRFIEALPQMLEGILVPDLPPPERRNTRGINPEELIQNAKSVIALNRSKIESALDSQNPIDEMLELGIDFIEQGYTWHDVAGIFEVIGNNLDDIEDFGDQMEVIAKISNEWHKRKIFF